MQPRNTLALDAMKQDTNEAIPAQQQNLLVQPSDTAEQQELAKSAIHSLQTDVDDVSYHWPTELKSSDSSRRIDFNMFPYAEHQYILWNIASQSGFQNTPHSLFDSTVRAAQLVDIAESIRNQKEDEMLSSFNMKM